MFFRAVLAALPLTIGLIGCSSSAEPAAGDATPTATAAPASATTAVFPVEGMVCEGCESSIKDAVSKLDGVVSCTASHEAKQAEVVFDAEKVKPEEIVAAISALGYKAAKPGEALAAAAP